MFRFSSQSLTFGDLFVWRFILLGRIFLSFRRRFMCLVAFFVRLIYSNWLSWWFSRRLLALRSLKETLRVALFQFLVQILHRRYGASNKMTAFFKCSNFFGILRCFFFTLRHLNNMNLIKHYILFECLNLY